jgi:hypothetical protein
MSLGDPYCGETKKWYECLLTTPQWFGCCDGDPCQNDGVCPTDPDKLSTTSFPATSKTTLLTSTRTSTPTTTTSATTTRSTIDASNGVQTRDPTEWFKTVTATPTSSSSSSHATPIAAIAGGAVGGFVLLLAIGAIWLFLLRRKEKRSSSAAVSDASKVPLKGGFGFHSRHSSADPAPGYSPAHSPYLDRTSMQKHPYSATPSPYPSPYLAQNDEGLFAELPSSSHDPVELAAGPGSPLISTLREDAIEELFGSSTDGGAHDRYSGVDWTQQGSLGVQELGGPSVEDISGTTTRTRWGRSGGRQLL